MPRPPPPAPRRRISPYRIQEYRYDANKTYKEPMAQTRRIGNTTRVIVSSAQDGYQNTNANYVPVDRAMPQIHIRSRRATDYDLRENLEYRRRSRSRSRSRSSSRNNRRRRSSDEVEVRYAAPYSRHDRRGSSESDESSDDEVVSSLEFKFDLSDSIVSGNSHQSSASLEAPLIPHEGGSVRTAGLTTDLHLVGSRWLGNTLDDWDLSVELTTAPGSSHLQPLMIWHHMERPLPTFDEFIAVARRELQQLPEKSLRRVEKMLRKIQKENEKQRQRGREMVPICMSDVEYQNDGNDDKQNFSASFSAFPFFSLQKLAENRSSTANAAHHPSRPLLQTYTRTVNDKRELSQAITTRPSTTKGHTLHVSSVWCLIVNDTIVTCGSMSLEELRKDFSSMPSQQHPSLAKTVRVKAGNTRSWSFSADELRSWPSLLATFADDLSTIGDPHARATITYQGAAVDATTCSRILARSTKFPIELVLENGKNDTEPGRRSKLRALKEAYKSQTTPPGPDPVSSNAADVTSPDDPQLSTAATRDEMVNRLRNIPALHVFHRDSTASKQSLSTLADSLHEKLETHPQKLAVSAYESCRESSLKDVQKALSQETISTRMNTNRAPATIADSKLGQIVIIAEYVFAFFWPLECDHIMARRFWGTLHQILDSEITGGTNPRRNADTAADFYYTLYHRVFAKIIVLTTNLIDSDIPLASFPTQFYEAWLHFLSAFVMLSESRRNDAGVHASWSPTEQLKAAARKLEDGELELVRRLRTVDAEDREVCSSSGIVALILNRLSRDVIHEGPDVAETYSDFCQQLDAKILENPLTRTHQASIRDLQQELEAVLSILTQQIDVVNVFERSIQAQDEDRRIPYLPLLLESRQDAVLATCKNTLAARIDRIKALQARVTELGEWHLGEIANNKDRQEAAIMVFTIVTIIFLPLSFVSSVFGMNTSDIRDMEFKQWLYWVVAVPLTVFVIAGSLYWAGALSDWQIGGSKESKTSYRPVVAERTVRMDTTRRAMVDEIDVEKMPRRRTTYPSRSGGREYV